MHARAVASANLAYTAASHGIRPRASMHTLLNYLALYRDPVGATLPGRRPAEAPIVGTQWIHGRGLGQAAQPTCPAFPSHPTTRTLAARYPVVLRRAAFPQGHVLLICDRPARWTLVATLRADLGTSGGLVWSNLDRLLSGSASCLGPKIGHALAALSLVVTSVVPAAIFPTPFQRTHYPSGPSRPAAQLAGQKPSPFNRRPLVIDTMPRPNSGSHGEAT